ncbi:MAG TPA: YbaN family protein [Atribacteraceae bacterium]|nr:YbaN family protein [Atribacteraceae bacterium]
MRRMKDQVQTNQKAIGMPKSLPPDGKSAHSFLLIFCGSVCIGLGAAGIVLPLLPTTPFLLLTAACFCRASPRLYRWLVSNRVFGIYIRAYLEKRGVPLVCKVLSLALLWTTIGFSAVAIVETVWVRWLLLGIAAGVTIHVFKLPVYHGK